MKRFPGMRRRFAALAVAVLGAGALAVGLAPAASAQPVDLGLGPQESHDFGEGCRQSVYGMGNIGLAGWNVFVDWCEDPSTGAITEPHATCFGPEPGTTNGAFVYLDCPVDSVVTAEDSLSFEVTNRAVYCENIPDFGCLYHVYTIIGGFASGGGVWTVLEDHSGVPNHGPIG